MRSKMSYNLINTRLFGTREPHSRRTLTECAQTQQAMNIKTSEKKRSTFFFRDTTDAPSTGSTAPRKQDSESQMYLLDSMEIAINLEKTLCVKPMPIQDDLHKSLKQHDLLGRTLHQDRQDASE